MCFNNAFLDPNGKLYLATCGVAGQNRLHLFQFDGYEFKAVKGELEELPPESHIQFMVPEGNLIGHAIDGTEKKLFSFDLKSGTLATQAVPGAGSITDIFLNRSGQLLVPSITNNAVALYEWKEGQLNTLGQVNLPTHLSGITDWGLRHGQSKTWLLSTTSQVLVMIDIPNNQIREIGKEDFELPFAQKSSLPIYFRNIKTVGERLFLTAEIKGKTSTLFELDSKQGKFIPVEGLNSNNHFVDLYSDKLGNYVYIFRKNSTSPIQAILRDQVGRRFDYSAFFADFKPVEVANLISPDFKKQLLVCSNAGVEFHRVKASEAIETVLAGKSIRAMVELPDQQFWVVDQAGDDVILDLATLEYKEVDNSGCIIDWAKLSIDKTGHIWAVQRGEKTINKISTKDNSCHKIIMPSIHLNFTEMGSDHLIILYTESNDRASVQKFDMINEVASPLLINGEPLIIDGFIHNLHYSDKEVLYAVTSNGLYQFDLKNQTRDIIGLEPPFLDSRFLCIYEDDRGRLWLGTPLGGLHIYHPATKELKILNSDSGLGNNTVASVIQDDDGDFWIGTYNGVSIVSPEGELITNLFAEDGLVHREANRYATLKTKDGKILLGTISGLNIIDPKKLKARISKNEELQIYLTSIKYFDPSANTEVTLESKLHELGTVILPAARRNLQVSFATSNYFNPLNNQYAYRLQGSENDWIPIGNQPTLSINNLPAGRYNIEVIGSDDKGNWTKTPLVISIDAKAYFYKQLWFYLLCVGLIAGLSLIWIQRLRTAVNRATQTIREDKETIEKQAEELKELDKAKSRFFTNISHEFRTPLTIISGMADQVKKKPEVWLSRGIDSIKQNTLNLLNLVNQILDLRKLESNQLTLDLVQGDIVKYLQYLSESYHSFGENAGIQLHFLAVQPVVVMDFDQEKILRIVSNLLANAIKYNKDGGHIYFHVDRKSNPDLQDELIVRIQDTGQGIPADQLMNIFGRFFQANTPGEKKIIGSGIGLALTYELVKLMGGDIQVQSELGKGTTFTFNLPITNNALSAATFLESSNPLLEETALASTIIENKSTLTVNPNASPTSESPSVLIVEDNPQIQEILIASLEDHYLLLIANNGQEGINMALEEIPDLIISDVMMPEKNGYELTDYLKNDDRTDHIPIVLLTAKSDVDSKISGLEKGADAYLAKPFESRELLVRLKKLLELRKKLQARYSHSSNEESQAPKIEDPFLQKFYSLVEKEISNPELDMNKIIRSMGMSRSQVFRKIKALTGKPPTQLIRSIRLQKSKILLATTQLTVAEIAYEVGFSSPSYFGAVFLEEFGISPNSTRK